MSEFFILITADRLEKGPVPRYKEEAEQEVFQSRDQLLAVVGDIVSGRVVSTIEKIYRVVPNRNAIEQLEPYLDGYRLLLRAVEPVPAPI